MAEPRPTVMSEAAAGGIAQFTTWADLDDGIARLFGDAGPLDHDKAARINAWTLFRIAPDRVQIHHADPAAIDALAGRIDPETGALCDLGHARAHLRLCGAGVQDALLRLAALDFDQGAFAVGAFRQTGIHGIHTLIHRTAADAFSLWLPTSWRLSVQSYIEDAAGLHNA